MASITIHNLDDEVETRLRLRAVAHGCSMAEEVRVILRQAVEANAGPDSLDEAIRARFAPVRSVEPVTPLRTPGQGQLEFE